MIMSEHLPGSGLNSLLEIKSLNVSYETSKGELQALRDVSLSIDSGEVFGIAGESGSGKSTLALAILNYLDSNGYVASGDILFDGQSLLSLSGDKLRSVRGDIIAHVPQDPKTALNPSLKVGDHVVETLEAHTDLSAAEATERTHELFEEVNLSEPVYTAQQYPHEISGGMQQRVLVAIALACDPDLIIMDEPTTGLDVTTQNKILNLIEDLKQSSTTLLIITHNLGVIGEVTDRVGILYAGEVMEVGPTERVFTAPANPYTKGLLEAVPDMNSADSVDAIPGQIPDIIDIPTGCIFADRCKMATEECRTQTIPLEQVDGPSHRSRCIHWADVNTREEQEQQAHSPTEDLNQNEVILQLNNLQKWYDDHSWLESKFGDTAPVKAVDGVSLKIRESETLGLVGESGCGKSTLARTVMGLSDVTDGNVIYNGTDITDGVSQKTDFHSATGAVFQNPHSSLNPERTVYEAIKRPIDIHMSLEQDATRSRVTELLEQVGLSPQYGARYPAELSGGEKQRVAIARAFAVGPRLVILDEPASALDVSVQANILELLQELQNKYKCAYLFISHDLSVIEYLCDSVAVMYLGEIVEKGTKSEVFNPPYHPYTRSLISNVQTTNVDTQTEKIELEGEVPSARDPPSGCSFHTRCPMKRNGLCEQEDPESHPVEGADSHTLSCHLERAELSDEIN